jgi:HPr kinase/phosphorylase
MMPHPAPVPLTDWAMDDTGGRLTLHASAVALGGRGVLIRGASGTGKSSLALQLLTRGASLIADDGVRVDTAGTVPFLERPDHATDLIESRGIGLLRAGPVCGRAELVLAIDLDRVEPERLPPRRMVTAGRAERPLILGLGHPTLADAVVHMLRHGRDAPWTQHRSE